MAARAVSARNSNRRSRPDPLPSRVEPVKPVVEPVKPVEQQAEPQVELETGYLVTVTNLGKHSTNFITWTVITDDPQEAIHLVKQRLCLHGYEKKYRFTTVKVTIVETNGTFQGIPIVEAKTEEPPPVHNN